MAKKQTKFADLEFVSALQALLKNFSGNRKALAAELAVHPSTLSRWINGQTTPSEQDRISLFALLLRRKENFFFRVVKGFSLAPPGVRAAFLKLLERGFEVWDEFDPATKNALCDLCLKAYSGDKDD